MDPHDADPTLRFLLGSWHVQRVLVDRRTDTLGIFTGRAVIGPDPGGGVWNEQGELRLGAFTGASRRTYLLRGGQQGGDTHVLFDDGRPFHRLALTGGGPCRVEHLCPPDRYTGVFVRGGDERMTSTWEVVGPRKSTVLLTTYRRLSPGGTTGR